MQTKTLWTLPFESVDMYRHAVVRMSSRDRLVIECVWFPGSDPPLKCELDFVLVSAIQVGFDFNATRVVGFAAYDKLVEVIDSKWTASANQLHEGGERFKHRHLAISFEEGPWVEVLCEDFKVTTSSPPRAHRS